MRVDALMPPRQRTHVVRLVRVLRCDHCDRWAVYSLSGPQAGTFDNEREALAFAGERASVLPFPNAKAEAIRVWCPNEAQTKARADVPMPARVRSRD